MGGQERTNTRQPRWVSDLERLLPIRSQFVLSGNIRDRFITPVDNGIALTSLLPCLWALLGANGFDFLLIYDRVDGVRVHPDTAEVRKRATDVLKLKLEGPSGPPIGLESLLLLMRDMAALRDRRVALVIDYASRLIAAPQSLGDEELRFLVGCEKLALTSMPIPFKDKPGRAIHNPVIWLVNRAQDLPSWFVIDNERVHSIEIARPDYEQRQVAANWLVGRFLGADQATETERAEAVRTFTESTDGLSLQALSDISQLAMHQCIGLRDIDDAIRCFKVGAVESPWKKDFLRKKIRDADRILEDRVKGQRQAIEKTIAILTRSVVGLTGAHARSSSSRPRGVLFFAGPTGVGKTELAKTLSQLLFGDERAYIRFDMSEFAEEHASARLLGAPPGYVGYDAGGELTNAVKQRPFSVILFDEIEKAHPRLLDKFLQILEDGRLTDGRGDTAYFSESILIFTSNLGIYVLNADGERVANVTERDPYAVVDERIRHAISDHFKFTLARPEILNRIGENIVVFSFIKGDVATNIFDGMLNNVVRRMREEHGLELIIPAAVRNKLLEWCTSDLANGGRGIGNQLEKTFINPLARTVFGMALEGRGSLTVIDVEESSNVFTVELQ